MKCLRFSGETTTRALVGGGWEMSGGWLQRRREEPREGWLGVMEEGGVEDCDDNGHRK